MSRFSEGIERIRRSVLETPGDAPNDLRQKVYDRQPVDEPLASYAAKIAEHPYRITDEDIDALKAAGYSEDAIFELTLAAATREGVRRYEIGMKALR